MAIIGAYALPHPPLAVPAVGRGNEEKISSTIAAFEQVANDIAALKPETIIFVTPHSVLYSDYFHISPGNKAKGDLSRFNAVSTKFDANYDTELINEIVLVSEAKGIYAGTLGEKDATLDHGVTVPMWFINSKYNDYKAVRISQSGMSPNEHYRFGQCIAEAVNNSNRKTVLIASGDLSHKLTADAPYGFEPKAIEFDNIVNQSFSTGNFMKLFDIDEALREKAAECGYNSFIILAGCFDRISVNAKLISYEGPFGVGYSVASFLPEQADENRNFLCKYLEASKAEAKKKQSTEDEYQALARQSLEHTIKYGKTLTLPDGLPNEMTNRRAGVFVSLHKNGRLRGCIGTIAPTTKNIAYEIIQNAVSAALNDNRFDLVDASELPYLTYKVDVLSAPESISSAEQLDVKRYGVIVSDGNRRGLLLPNLEGVSSVYEQIEIARKKGGIPDNAAIKLERFEVVRHE